MLIVADDIEDVYTLNTWNFLCGKSQFKLLNESIYIMAAPEPEDVIWKNLSFTFFQRFIRLSLNFVLTGIILAACSIAIYFLAEYNVQFLLLIVL